MKTAKLHPAWSMESLLEHNQPMDQLSWMKPVGAGFS